MTPPRVPLLFESHPLPMWVYDLDTLRFLAVNDAAVAKYGYTRDEFLTLTLADIRPPEDVPALRAAVAQVTGGASPISEWRHRTKAGDTFPVEIHSHTLEFDGRPAELIVARDITERATAEAALRASESRFRAYVEQASDALFVHDIKGRVIDVNRRACTSLGYTRDELLGMTVFDVEVGIDLVGMQAGLRLMVPDETFTLLGRHRRKDGSTFPVEVQFGCFDVQGERQYMGIARDITVRVEATKKLEHLNRVLAVLSGINQTIVREANPEAMLAAACRTAVETGGFALAWMGLVETTRDRLELRAHAGADAETQAVIDALLEVAPATGCAFTSHALLNGEHAICNDISSDARAVPWRQVALQHDYGAMAAFPVRIGDTVVGTFNLYADDAWFFDADEVSLLDDLAANIGFALDMARREDARRAAEAQVRVSEERFRELAETVEEVFWVTDATASRILYVSPSYATVWGRSRDSLYVDASLWLDAIHPDDRVRVEQAARAKSHVGTYDEEYRIVRPDGQIRWVRDRAFPVRNASGDVERVVGAVQDITESRRLSEELRQSQKMEAIGQLAGGVAHDFNNLLGVMMLQLELATDAAPLPETVRESLDEIRAAVDRAADLTRQLLLFSRRQVMQVGDVALNEIVNSLVRLLQRIIGEDVRLVLRLADEPLTVRADAGMLDQVLMNLAVNARDAMPDGGTLTIETLACLVDDADVLRRADAAAGPFVCLRVRDTGTGIAPDVLPRIFDPFFTTKPPGKGTGLGLATVFGIVRQHGGWVTVSSMPGGGTTFDVFIPASTATEGDVTVPVAEPPRDGTETILLVEDDDAVRRSTRALLERHGYRVIEANNGSAALDAWATHRQDVALLLTDLVMPEGLSGLAVARRLQAEAPTLPIVYTSGYSAELAGRQLDLGPEEVFLQKPYPPDDLLHAVRQRLDG